MACQWTELQLSCHDNLKELYAVCAVIQQTNSQLHNAHILLQSDKRTVVAQGTKQGLKNSTRKVEPNRSTFSI
ncbi:putative transposon Ty3-I Gag-Pol polyprotein [Operophtera brumata]|uniref:Putative transposon Ty3-I Gag-Pol polyprotein n=1 Tax=Operophtera brumata TaxID=104452 RepID=A0A0L7KTG8_OPEBR|nr:putative transposon Ty3-I Gag-Pol polyprotein [Operophtera brumata]